MAFVGGRNWPRLLLDLGPTSTTGIWMPSSAAFVARSASRSTSLYRSRWFTAWAIRSPHLRRWDSSGFRWHGCPSDPLPSFLAFPELTGAAQKAERANRPRLRHEREGNRGSLRASLLRTAQAFFAEAHSPVEAAEPRALSACGFLLRALQARRPRLEPRVPTSCL